MTRWNRIREFAGTYHIISRKEHVVKGLLAYSSRIEGFLDDYAFLIRGLLDYYKSSLDMGALRWAKELQETQDKLFWDEKNGAYFFSQQDAPNVIVRLKEGARAGFPAVQTTLISSVSLSLLQITMVPSPVGTASLHVISPYSRIIMMRMRI